MSYFFHRTSPLTIRVHHHIEKNPIMKHLKIFKKTQAVSNMLTQEESLSNFIPVGVIQRVSIDGKKYLEIIANPSTFDSSDHKDTLKPHHLSVTFSDKVDIIGTETLDSWISPFGSGNQMDVESQSNRASIEGHSSGTAEIAHRIKSATHHIPAVHSGFGLSIIDDTYLGRLSFDEINTSTALQSHPPPSPSPSICDESDRKESSCSNKNPFEALAEPKSVQGLGNRLLSSDTIQSEDDQLCNCLTGQGRCWSFSEMTQHQCTRTEAQHRNDGQLSELSSLQPITATKEPNRRPPETEFEFGLSALQLAKLRRGQKICAQKPQESNSDHRDIENNINTWREKAAEDNLDSSSLFFQPTAVNKLHTSKTPKSTPSTPKTGNQLLATLTPTQKTPSVLLKDNTDRDVTTWKKKQNRKSAASIILQNQIPTATTLSTEATTPPSLNKANTIRISSNLQVEPASHTPNSSLPPQVSIPSVGFATRTAKIRKLDQDDEPLVTATYTPTRRQKFSLGQNTSRTRVLGASPILDTEFPAPPTQQRLAVHNPSAISGDGSVLWAEAGEKKGKDNVGKLEGRIEVLERENRMLEAALMAVLRTGGALNGCPCGVLRSGEESIRSSSRGSERRGNGVSVLEVYLGTRRRFGGEIGSSAERNS